MDRNYVSENQIVDRYLRDELTEQEQAEFEAFYLSDQETLAELELAEKLQLGLRASAEQGALPPVARPNPFRRFITSPQWAAAASVLLVVSMAYSGFLYIQQQDGGRQANLDVSTPRLVPVFATRGADAVPVPRGQDGGWVVLLVDPGFDSYDDYRAKITESAGGTVVWEVQQLQPGYEELLAIGVAGSVLRSGAYEIRIEARSGADGFVEISRLPIRVP
jgi:hypothetical protein